MIKNKVHEIIFNGNDDVFVVHPEINGEYLVSRHKTIENYSYPNGGGVADAEITYTFEPESFYKFSEVQLEALKFMNNERKLGEEYVKILAEGYISERDVPSEMKDAYKSALQKDHEIASEARNQRIKEQKNAKKQEIDKDNEILAKFLFPSKSPSTEPKGEDKRKPISNLFQRLRRRGRAAE